MNLNFASRRSTPARKVSPTPARCGHSDSHAIGPESPPSFDCDAPPSALEIAICSDAELGQLDIQLAQAYRDAKTIMVDAQQKDLIESERQWLRFVNGACPLAIVGGIPSVFERSCLRAAFQARIVQLQTCPQKREERVSCLNDFHVLENKQSAQSRKSFDAPELPALPQFAPCLRLR